MTLTPLPPRATGPARPQRCGRSATSAAFTLVELMVAITGGLFVSMVVFALAREGSRFYQQESRIAETTLGTVVAFDRLVQDVSRAGFMSTPNLRQDPLYCGDATAIGTLPAELQNLASIRIEEDATAAGNAVLSYAERKPQTITLSGAFDSVDRYEAWHVDKNDSGTGYVVRLQTNIGPLLRLGFSAKSATDRAALLAQLFPEDRALRLLNIDTGTFQVSTIASTKIDGTEAYIYLDAAPALILTDKRCGLRGTTLVNVVNVVRYALRTVKGKTGTLANYQQLFNTGAQPFEDDRLELVREELNPTDGSVGSQEVVAEYAVDLQFGLTTVANLTTTPTLTTTGFDAPDTVEAIAGATSDAVNARPQDIRAVRARLSLRSREVDRDADILTGSKVGLPLYRIRLYDSTSKTYKYARVRTLQTDAVIGSHMELRWQ